MKVKDHKVIIDTGAKGKVYLSDWNEAVETKEMILTNFVEQYSSDEEIRNHFYKAIEQYMENEGYEYMEIDVKSIPEDTDGICDCTDCGDLYNTHEGGLFGDLHKIHYGDDEWLNSLFTEDDLLCNDCLEKRVKKGKNERIQTKTEVH